MPAEGREEILSKDKEKITRAILSTDGRTLIEQSDGSYREAESQTDWARVDGLTEEEIEEAARSDPDNPLLDDEFWKDAEILLPEGKERVTMRLDKEVVDWFRQEGKGYQSRMNAVLRSYMKASSEKRPD